MEAATMEATAAPVTKDERDRLTMAFLASRPGFEPGDCATAASDRQDVREATRDRHDAERMLGFVMGRTSITAEMMTERLSGGGRLSLGKDSKGRPSFGYCAGQYYPTESRAAVCRWLASLLREYWWPEKWEDKMWVVRTKATRQFGRGLASRWF